LVAVQEHLSDKQKAHVRKSSFTRPKNRSAGNNSELWKARQLKEFRRANNLCFNCGDKYTLTHTCTSLVANLHAIQSVIADGGSFLSEELLELLEQPQLNML
jgi:hypothetical protein